MKRRFLSIPQSILNNFKRLNTPLKLTEWCRKALFNQLEKDLKQHGGKQQ